MASIELNAIVSQKIDITPTMTVLRIVPDGWDLPEFTPGQFTTLGLPASAGRRADCDPCTQNLPPDKIVKRAYSIASSSVAKEHLEFLVSLVKSGALTPRLFDLKIGDKIHLGKKFTGFFTLEEVPAEANVILVGTGTGLAPYMSMVRTDLIKKTRPHLAILHGAANSWDLAYNAELMALQLTNPTFSYIPVLDMPDREPVPWKGEVGFVQDVWRRGTLDKAWGFHPSPENTHVFLCGNPLMIEAMEDLLQAEEFNEHKRKDPGTYHLERYW
ncbi:ferredoxin--NADP reductase [Oligoflexia bacterium]|nr:ferredoxin--NADP reductase [Oligoflexia bacterium]